MVNILQNFSKYLLGAIICFIIHSSAYSQELASVKKLSQEELIISQNDQKSLQAVLNDLEKNHQVSFALNDQLIEGKFVDHKYVNSLSLEENLNSILEPLDLTWKKIEEYYIIQPLIKKNKGPDKVIIEPKKEKKDLEKEKSNLEGRNILKIEKLNELLQAQDHMVSGTITSTEGEPLPGVNIVLKGTSQGTITDIEGNYNLRINDPNGTLIYSYIGYVSQEIPVEGRNQISLSLTADVTALSEVVVIGYGTAKRSDLTGAVANIKAERLLDRQAFNVGQALQGRIPGVDVYANSAAPGAPPRIRIRGINSINSGVDPLYVVDGVIGVNANALDPNNIESVEVLKDASSTAIYGARGANGVILITTKRGLEGKSVITYDGFGSYSVPAKKLGTLNSEEFMQVYNLAFANAEKYDPAGFAAGRYQPNRVEDFPELFDENGNPRYNTNWEDLTYQPAWAQNHHLSVQGGAEKTVYSVALGFTDQDGIMRNSWFKRYNAKFTLDNQVNEWLRIGGSVTGLFSRRREVNDNSGALNVPRMVMEAVPIIPVRFPDGRWAGNTHWPGMEGGENPVRLTEERERIFNTTEVLGDIYAQINILPNLEFRTSFGYDLIGSKNNHYSGRDVNGFSANQRGHANIGTNTSRYWQSENYFTFNQGLFNNTHTLTAMAGFSWQEYYREDFSATAENFIDDFYGWHNLGVGNVRGAINSYDERWALNSYFGRVNYNIDDRYIFTATGRIDGSSKFGRNNKYAFFPSVGVAWRISEEDFFDFGPVSNLKLRASAGSTGNQEINPFQSLQFLGTETILLDGSMQTGIFRSSFGNPDLKWEVTHQYDIGLEVGLLENRIDFMADFYYKKTNDLLLAAPIPWSTGLASVTQNIGSVENKGLELSLNTLNISQGNFSWSTNLNWATNRNRILQLGVNNDDIFPGPWFLGQTQILRVGEPIGSFWGYRRLGTFSTDEEDLAAQYNRLPGDLKWADLNNDGVIDAQDETIIGRAYPKWTGNISNTIIWGNFDFTFDIRIVQGVNIVNATKHSVEDRQAIASSSRTVLDAWTPQNQNTHIAEIRHYNAGYDTHMDDWWMEDGSFIRGQNFVLGYRLPALTAERIGIQGLRVYLSSQNLFLISDYSGYDPEALTFGGNLTQNIEFFQYPKPRTFNLGVNVSF